MRTTTSLVAVLTVVGALLLPTAAVAQDAEPTVSHQVIEGKDGVPIYSTLFLPPGASAENPVPVILRSHGWGGQGERSLEEASSTTKALLDDGYAVFSWDERGFGWSGGEVHVLKPDLEGVDATKLLDWIVANVPEIARDGDDPIVGMSGLSYGGGIQTLLSALDPRIDAIAPEITWFDLRYSLYDNEVINLGWGQLLYAAGMTAQTAGMNPESPTYPQTGGYAEEIHQAQVEGDLTNQFSEESVDFFGRSSLAVYQDTHGEVDVPALFMQGSVDTLFDLTEADWLHEHVKANGAPTRYIAYCGGHVSCPSSYETPETPDREFLDQAILDWFAKYLRGEDVDTGAPVTYRTNLKGWTDADDFPPSNVSFETVEIDGATVVSTGAPSQEDNQGQARPVAQPSQEGDPRATTIDVFTAEGGDIDLVGVPSAKVTVEGQGIVHLFFKLLDKGTGEIVNLQETPLRVDFNADGSTQEFEIPMSGVAYTLAEGNTLALQVATNSVMHATSRVPGEATITGTVDVPVVLSGSTGTPARDDDVAGAPDDGGTRSSMPDTGGGLALLAVPALFGAVLLRRLR